MGEHGHDVDALGNLVLDGVFTVLSEVDEGSSGSGSCTVASIEAAHVPHGCSSCMVASTGYGEKSNKSFGGAALCDLWAKGRPLFTVLSIVQERIWTFQDSGSVKCVMQRGVGLPGSDATSVMLHVTRFLTTPHGSFGEGTSSVAKFRSFSSELWAWTRSTEEQWEWEWASPGADVGPGSGGNEVGEKGEAGELLQALSLLQKIMSPEDFAK